MKKYLLILLALVSISVYGQIQKQVTFDFTQPSSLNPALPTLDPDETLSLEITQKVFKSGKVSISFERGSVYGGAQYKINADGNGYYLEITRSCTMTFKAESGSAITDIIFSDDSSMKDFHLIDGESGLLEPNSMGRYWSCNGNSNVTSVSFRNSGESSHVKKITVRYTEPVNVLEPVSVTPTSKVESFAEMNLTFSSAMTIASTSGIYMVDSKNVQYPLTASYSGNVITLSLAEPITTDGIYRIVIPAGCFRNYEGYCNKNLEYSVTVETPKNILNYESVDPEPGEIDVLPNVITLTYPDYYIATIPDGTVVPMYKDESSEVLFDVTVKNNGPKGVTLHYDVTGGINDKGIYRIVVPENTIKTSQASGIYNPAFTLEYKVGYAPESIETETMKKAKELLLKTGVGYPEAESASRTALQNLVDKEGVTDAELLEGIDAFYKETDVKMPDDGKYYTISGVSQNKGEWSNWYLVYTDGVISLSSVSGSATHFKAVTSGDAVSFQTADGNYLNVNGVSSDERLKGLSLRKFSVDNVEPASQFGLFSITGSIVNKQDKVVADMDALIDLSDNTYGIDATMEELCFDSELSNAFFLSETTKQDEELVVADMVCSLSPSTLTADNGVLTLAFNEDIDVIVEEKAEAELANENKGKIQTVSLTKSKDKANELKVAVSGLPDGTYYIVLPEKTVRYTTKNVTYTNKRLDLLFTVKTESGEEPGDERHGDNENFMHEYNDYTYYPSLSGYIKDVDLNTFSIAAWEGNNDFYVDETRIVKLMQVDTARKIAEGHFKRISEFPGDPNNKNAYQIVFDTPIAEGSLKADSYTFIIEPATIGNNNFAQYVAGSTSVSASDCNVNWEIKPTYWVNNSIVSGISDVNISSTPSDAVIYDLTGRRVQSMSKAGVYIVNGRKVVVR